ncbi:T9SS C-terminal target domain-containing protein [Bacteroidetes/Chlorobi group bacterium ChocPot_Mid]|nr:MAG: T9SS C-terminal target domain-containing protein [Bacteroidetes/Chlorobi group bacterium ChocPot_Mid]
MKYLVSFTILIIASCIIKSQPITQTERNAGLEPKINKYIYSETYSGSDTAWILTNTRTQSFDNTNKLNIFEQEKYDSNGAQKDTRWEHTYTGNLLTELKVFSWKDNDWQLTSKTLFEYDENGKITTNTNYFKNDDGEMLIGSITLTSYDENGRISEITSYRSQGVMADTNKQINTYDNDGNMIELLNQKYRNGNWVNNNVTYFFYNNGKYVGQEYKFWYGPELLIDYMDSIFYDNQDRRIARVHYKAYDDEYELDYRYTWSYDENNRIAEEYYQDWVAIDWGEPSKVTFSYDEKGNLTERHKMQMRSDEWTEKEITYISYNEYDYVTDFQFYIWLVTDWLRNTRMTYEYGEVSVNDKIAKSTTAMNYPNPFTTETNIKFFVKDSGKLIIKIMDLNGNVLRIDQITNPSAGEQNYQFNSSNLPSGIYFYSIESNNESFFNSFIINK